jgi:shikimate dehydrogenase
MKEIKGTTRITGIIGYPITHTFSPKMHNAAFTHLGLDYVYVPFDVKPEDLKAAIQGLRALNVAGVNVTIPHKENVIPLLDEVDKDAQIIGAVNTIQNREGRLIGYNTDGQGFLDALRITGKFDPTGKKVVLLGAGGAARAVSVMLCKEGISALSICDMVEEKAKKLTKDLKEHFELEIEVCPPKEKEMAVAIKEADLVINATPVGMHPSDNESPLPEGIRFHEKEHVFDLVYNPSETLFIKAAKAAGAKHQNGLGMLLRQGAVAFQIFTGQEAPVEVMRAALLEGLKA